MYYKKRKMINKKAQGLSITTIILIILGVIVLVMLIVGFTMGWGGIRDWIAPSNNVQQIVSQCEIACATGGKYDFCFAKRDLKSEDEKLEEVSCYTLNKVKSQYGVGDCKAIDCGIYKTVELDSNLNSVSTECTLRNDKETFPNLPRVTEDIWFIGNDAKLIKKSCEFILQNPDTYYK